MDTAKDEVRRILDALPDDATLEDIQYRLYVRQAIGAGMRDIVEGRTLSQEEVEQRVARWIGEVIWSVWASDDLVARAHLARF